MKPHPTATDTLGPPRTGIVVLNYNGLEDTLECLESLEPVQSEHVRVWLVDNASRQDPSETVGQRFPWCDVIRSDVNGGWAGGNNLGIRAAMQQQCDWILLLNNDTRVSDRIVERLLAAAETDRRLGILGPLINEWDPPDQVQTAACLFNRPEHDGMLQSVGVAASPASPAPANARRADDRPPQGDVLEASPPPIMDTDIVNGCCMMIGRDVIEQIGEIDERFFLIHEESDLCLRAKQAGFACGVLLESHVWHKHSVTFGRDPSPLQRYYGSRNSWLLTRKHRDFPSARRPWATRALILRHCWYLMDHDLEHGQTKPAMAVVEGTLDAWLGRFGKRTERNRTADRLLGWCVSQLIRMRAAARRRRGGEEATL